MPGSDALRGPLRAAGAALLLALPLWASGWALAAPAWTWTLYRRPLGETLGHRLAGKLDLCRAAGARCVLILGASSAREGFDEQLLDGLCPGRAFVNAGLAGGSIETLEVGELLLRKSGARPGAIVAALHPFMLRHLSQNLVASGYSDFFDALDGQELLRYEREAGRRGEARRELMRNALFPPARHARLLGRRLRAAFYDAHSAAYWGPKLPRRAFEVAPQDTQPAQEFLQQPGSPAGMAERWQRMRLLSPRAYADPALADALDRLLHALQARTGRLIVMRMPEHSYLRERAPLFGPERFERCLAQAHARGAGLLDYSSRLDDGEFVDLGHAAAAGRERLSRALAADFARETRP